MMGRPETSGYGVDKVGAKIDTKILEKYSKISGNIRKYSEMPGNTPSKNPISSGYPAGEKQYLRYIAQ